jgi:DNA-binding PucR family transcriptional regulator
LQLYSQSRKGSVDYWETLKVYLNNEMNATQTAKELYLHRSTLLQRLAKINTVLGLDLHNPLQRMYIHACIYILDMKVSSEKLFKDFEAESPRPQTRM